MLGSRELACVGGMGKLCVCISHRHVFSPVLRFTPIETLPFPVAAAFCSSCHLSLIPFVPSRLRIRNQKLVVSLEGGHATNCDLTTAQST